MVLFLRQVFIHGAGNGLFTEDYSGAHRTAILRQLAILSRAHRMRRCHLKINVADMIDAKSAYVNSSVPPQAVLDCANTGA